MSTEVVVPALGESVTEATVAGWLKNTGDMVALDEPIVELETDKVTVEVNSPVAGMLDRPNFKVGETVDVGAILCIIKDSNDNTQAVVDKETLVPTAAGGESADSISVNTAAKGTPIVAIAIVNPNNPSQGCLKLKGSSGSHTFRSPC